MQARTFYCDTETTGLDVWGASRPFAVGVIDDDDVEEYIEWFVDPKTREVCVNPDDVDYLSEKFSNPEDHLVKHHSKFDWRMLMAVGVQIECQIHDTMIAARVCNSLEPFIGLKPLARKYLKMGTRDEEELKDAVRRLRRRARKHNYLLADDVEADYWLVQHWHELGDDEAVAPLCEKYCMLDVARTKGLWEMYKPLLEDPRFKETYEREMALQPEVMRMEKRGVRLSVSKTLESKKASQKLSDHHLHAVRQMAHNQELNPASAKQLVMLLYEPEPHGFGLEPPFLTPKGNPSVDAKALEANSDHPFIRELLGYRTQQKGLQFFEAYLAKAKDDPLSTNPDHKVLHSSFKQAAAVTGRFSCEEPNLQQVSNPATTRSGDAVNARTPFGPREGYVWYGSDYGSMESRVFADVGNIKSMLTTFAAGEDVNDKNANAILGGKNNHLAVEFAIQFLELAAEVPSSKEVETAWGSLGWNVTLARKGMKSTEASLAAAEWLRMHDYDIILAEKALAKGTMRARIKSLLFNEIYGGGDGAAAELLKCPVPEAARLRTIFKNAFPEIGNACRALARQAEQKGYIVTRYNRLLMIEPGYSYKATNYMVQGTCADLMKSAMISCGKFLRDTGIDGHIVLTIHDELIFEIRKEHCYKWILRELMRRMSDHGGRLAVEMPVKMSKYREGWDVKEPVCL